MSFRKKFIGTRAFYASVLALLVPMIVQQGITQFVNLLDNELLSLSESTLRPAQNIYCRDIDEDGLIEIPTVSTLPGYEDLLSEDIPFLTTYNQLLPNEQL